MNRRLLAVAGLGTGALLLALFAFHFSVAPGGAPLTAATWLGDQQGVPSGFLGRVTPDFTTCWVGNDANNPVCVALTNPIFPISSVEGTTYGYTFYSAVLSLSPTKGSAGSYPTNTYVAANWVKDTGAQNGGDWGAAAWIPESCSGDGGCSDGYWYCNNYPAPPSGDRINYYDIDNFLSPFPNPNYDGSAFDPATMPPPNAIPYECWAQRFIPEYPPASGANPNESGQTAYATTTYTKAVPLVALGPAIPDGTDPITGQPIYTCSDYTPRVAGDQVVPDSYNSVLQCWELKSNPSPFLLHGVQKLIGVIPQVDPGDSLTAQWTCLPSRTVDYKTRYCYHPVPGITICDHNQGLQYQLGTVFTGATSPDFAASSINGKAPIIAPAKPGLYTYSLTCQGAKPLTLSVKFRVRDTTNITCKIATLEGSSARLQPGAWEFKTTVEGTSYDFCINNPSGTLTYLVPLKTRVEVEAFLGAVNSAAGVGDGTDTLDQVY